MFGLAAHRRRPRSQQPQNIAPDFRQRGVYFRHRQRIDRHIHHFVRRLGAVTDTPITADFRKMIDDLIAVIEGIRRRGHTEIRNLDPRALEKLAQLKLLRLALCPMGKTRVDHARHDIGRGYVDALRARLDDFDQPRLDITLLLADDFGLDRFSGERSGHEYHPAVAKPTEPVAAVDVLCDIYR